MIYHIMICMGINTTKRSVGYDNYAVHTYTWPDSPWPGSSECPLPDTNTRAPVARQPPARTFVASPVCYPSSVTLCFRSDLGKPIPAGHKSPSRAAPSPTPHRNRIFCISKTPHFIPVNRAATVRSSWDTHTNRSVRSALTT